MHEKLDVDGRPKTVSQRAPLEKWDALSIFVLAITVLIGLYFVMIFVDPNSSFNPFPPVPLGPEDSILTATPLQSSVTSTASPNIGITIRSTKIPSFTSAPKMPFSTSSISAVKSTFILHLQDLGCGWFGVGGTVDDANNSPIFGVVVRLTGTLGGNHIELTTLSGVSPDYGKAGYEFVLGKIVPSSDDKLYVQLIDPTGLPLSEKMSLPVSADCEKNLILVRFKKNR
ncbi:hypothetical protein MASR2M66_31130 [Chloroflexota bacterium]